MFTNTCVRRPKLAFRVKYWASNCLSDRRAFSLVTSHDHWLHIQTLNFFLVGSDGLTLLLKYLLTNVFTIMM
jgi:hypothetical protein